MASRAAPWFTIITKGTAVGESDARADFWSRWHAGKRERRANGGAPFSDRPRFLLEIFGQSPRQGPSCKVATIQMRLFCDLRTLLFHELLTALAPDARYHKSHRTS